MHLLNVPVIYPNLELLKILPFVLNMYCFRVSAAQDIKINSLNSLLKGSVFHRLSRPVTLVFPYWTFLYFFKENW